MKSRAVAALFVTLLCPSPSAAQSGGAVSLVIPPNVRAEGMGGAAAVLDNGPFAAWGNPAGVAFGSGFRFGAMSTRLVPDLADDVTLDHQAAVYTGRKLLKPGALNFGAGFQRTHLGYGESLGGGEATETSFGGTVAVGFKDMAAVGVSLKNVKVEFPTDVLTSGGEASTQGIDYGLQGRTPPLWLRLYGHPEPVMSLRFLGGVAWANRGGELDFGGVGGEDPLSPLRRESLGAVLHVVPLRSLFPEARGWLGGRLADSHLLTIEGAFGRERDLLVEEDSGERGVTTRRGIEARFFDVVAIRSGSVHDPDGQVEGGTFGIGFSWLGVAGFDYVRVPQFGELRKVNRVAFWFHVPIDGAS